MSLIALPCEACRAEINPAHLLLPLGLGRRDQLLVLLLGDEAPVKRIARPTRRGVKMVFLLAVSGRMAVG